METMWRIFQLLNALEPVLFPDWQTHSRRPLNISPKLSVGSHSRRGAVTAVLADGWLRLRSVSVQLRSQVKNVVIGKE